MEIGQKLKNARAAAGLTQEAAAEKIGVSRQTVSNWENNRSYPDILSVLTMSELYRASLDELLKGDPGMTAHLEDSTNLVKSRKRLAKTVWFACYLLVWALCILFFWLGGRSDAMGYSLSVLYLVLPAATIAFPCLWDRRSAVPMNGGSCCSCAASYTCASLTPRSPFQIWRIPLCSACRSFGPCCRGCFARRLGWGPELG